MKRNSISVVFLMVSLVLLGSNAEKSNMKNAVDCTLCKQVMTAIDQLLVDENTEEAILDALDQVCSLLPDVEEQCDFFINEYGDDILEILVDQYLDPLEVCQSLGLCALSLSMLDEYE